MRNRPGQPGDPPVRPATWFERRRVWVAAVALVGAALLVVAVRLIGCHAAVETLTTTGTPPASVRATAPASAASTALPQSTSTTEPGVALFPVLVNDLYGYMDATGRLVIQPQYISAEPFSEGLAVVWVGSANEEKCGYIDPTGRMVIHPELSGGMDFSEGLAAAAAGDKWGYIDKTGAWVVSPQFDDAQPFADGLALVRVGEGDQGKYGFIDHTGAMVILPQFDMALPFSEGLAMVSKPVGENEVICGYIDKTGKLVIDYQYYQAWSFAEGLAAVVDTSCGMELKYIDTTGAMVVDVGPSPPNPGGSVDPSFSEGLAPAWLNGKWGFIDHGGNVVIQPRFDAVGGFSEGVATISQGTERLPAGYIDRTGAYVGVSRYLFAGPYQNGVAWVALDADPEGLDCAYIDKNGRVLRTWRQEDTGG